jgi:DNA-binding winged helix-turn-helix (wHTH) protein/Tol biopolymer transport system component
MATPSRTSQRVRFGEFELDLSTRELWANGTKQTLAPQPFQVLQILIENRGQLVSRDALVRHLWPSDTFVDYEQGLKKAVNRLRETLNDSAEQPRFIETLPRQGYRLIGNLEFDTAVRDRSADALVVMPKRVPDEPGAEIAKRKPIPTIHLLWVSAAIIIGVAGILVWRSRVSRHASPVVSEPKTTQVIANSFENPVTSSAVSPDGKYLAFVDNGKKIRIKLLGTGETRTIPQPESLNGRSVDWTIAGWFPDSTRFIANSRAAGSPTQIPGRIRLTLNSPPITSTDAPVDPARAIWVVSVLGNTPQRLRDGADGFSVSPDGLWIAFGTNPGQLGDREIWLMDTKGVQSRKLYEAPEKAAIGNLQWLWDGQRTIYLEVGDEKERLVSRDLRGGPAVPLVQYSGWWTLTDFVSLPDGRLIYAYNGNFWQLRIDPRNGVPTQEPRQLTNWSGLWLGYTSVTSDGKRLAFQRSAPQTTVNVADIEANGTQLSSLRHLTLNEYSNAAETWTSDSHALIFRSGRNGHGKLFKQALDSDTEEPLVMGAENVGGSAISPDGLWLIYLQCENWPTGCDAVVPVMRIPIYGGEPRQVLRSETYGRPRCTFSPANLCVIAEQSADGKPLIFTAFDVLKGRGAEIGRFETDAAAQYHWTLSADGNRAAILKFGDNRIHIVSFSGQRPQEVVVKRWTKLAGSQWAADDKGWFTSSTSEKGVVLLYVDFQGEAHPLLSLNGGGSKVYGLPSPDGRHLAIVSTARNNNVWMMENF